jgi:ribosomal protein L11 methyltransferase
MEYTQVTCTLTPDTELAREILMAELGNTGFESFVETETGVEAYIPTANFTPELLLEDNLQKNEFFTFHHTVEVIADQNWNEVWEQNYFEPLLIEDECMVRAPFHDTYPEARYQIIINPRMAFGTGNHETTHLMIKAMLALDVKDKIVLDMGCGSGILSILSSMMGAAKIMSIDIDEWSVNNTIENAELNQIDNILVRLGDASLLLDQQFDIVLANIQRNILLQDMPAYRKVLKNGGIIIMSGFYTADLDSIKEKASFLGLKFFESFERSDWCAASFKA